ncbi:MULTISPECIES: hypothetical protein [Thermomonospora]|uniref:Uncharacterized protein n=1 Tax=Thermomonospora cellulosilytica TaxID=1411118 RepID=A0A7W3MWW7_9ACTN|nr:MULTISPECIES: hypothetical protein [Thermomonospora]MBA9003371.1 hypothetical protein [Thermomonospora cellulosilytica]
MATGPDEEVDSMIALPHTLPTALRKTRTAAEYVHRSAAGPLAREHAVEILRTAAAYELHPAPAAAPLLLADLLTAVAECAGPAWLKANADDPDIARFTALVDQTQDETAEPPTITDLDELLAAVLWTRHGPAEPDTT